MQWWEIYVQVPEPLGDAVSAYLQELGSGAVVIHEQTTLASHANGCLDTVGNTAFWIVLQGALPQQESLLPQITALQQFLQAHVQPAVSPQWRLYCQPLQDTEYLTSWQHFFQPLCIADRLYIRPSWDTSPIPSTMAYLTLDPGLAFGTGTHPTTRLCLQLLVQLLTPAGSGCLLDVGCGSGILSLAALTLGVDTAVAVDIDAQAVEATQHNARLNTLHERLHCIQGSVDDVVGQFAWILANIYLGPLIEMLPLFRRRLAPAGTVVLSGILGSQEETLRERLTNAGFVVRQRGEDTGWVALAVQRREDVGCIASV